MSRKSTVISLEEFSKNLAEIFDRVFRLRERFIIEDDKGECAILELYPLKQSRRQKQGE